MKISPHLLTLFFSLSVSADKRVYSRQTGSQFSLENGFEAIALNEYYQTLSAGSPCQVDETACLLDQYFGQCVNGSWVLTTCNVGLVCRALPENDVSGTNIACTTEADAESLIASTGASIGNGSSDPSTSLLLDPSVIAPGFASDGQQVPAAGQSPSLTTTNNFINFCLTVGKPLTNGQQLTNGSCNPTPMGVIPAVTNIPSAKFVFPTNSAQLPVNITFPIQLAIRNLETGWFTNAESNYFAAPQQVGSSGDVLGHSHVVIERLESLDQTTPLDPTQFVFFKGLNEQAVNGILSTNVTGGLSQGFYRLSSIHTAANHQPVLVPVAQHGSLEDVVYFTVV